MIGIVLSVLAIGVLPIVGFSIALIVKAMEKRRRREKRRERALKFAASGGKLRRFRKAA